MYPLIGNTPLCTLSRFFPEGNLLAKAEFLNLTGSVKDRAAYFILQDAENRGLLDPGGTVIEPTSGNMGISLAALCAIKGYKAILVMPDSMSPERQRLMTVYGAQVVLTPGVLGMAAAVEKAKELANNIPGSFIPDQFSNPANALAHYRTTGPEIWAQANGMVDIFVAGVGTGGTITGTGRYFKEKNPAIRIVAAEPAASPLLSGGKAGSHGIQGIGANFIPHVLDRTLLDEIIPVSDAAAIAASRKLAQTEGLFAGISAGAALYAAALLASRPENHGKTIVTLLPDSGQRYLSSGL